MQKEKKNKKHHAYSAQHKHKGAVLADKSVANHVRLK